MKKQFSCGCGSPYFIQIYDHVTKIKDEYGREIDSYASTLMSSYCSACTKKLHYNNKNHIWLNKETTNNIKWRKR